MQEDTTSLRIAKTTLAFFNQLKSEEAGARGKSTIDQDKFLRFLLLLYQRVRNDPVLQKIREKEQKWAQNQEKDASEKREHAWKQDVVR